MEESLLETLVFEYQAIKASSGTVSLAVVARGKNENYKRKNLGRL